MSIEAEHTLRVISQTFFNGKNYNNSHYYDKVVINNDGTLTGRVHKIIKRGESEEVGLFCIDASGNIKEFPVIDQGFIDSINGDKKPSGSAIVPGLLPDTPENRKIVEDVSITEIEGIVDFKKGTITPVKKRGRKPGWSPKNKKS